MHQLGKTWQERYQELKEFRGLSDEDLSRITGLKLKKVKKAAYKIDDLPPWLKLAVVIHEEKPF